MCGSYKHKKNHIKDDYCISYFLHGLVATRETRPVPSTLKKPLVSVTMEKVRVSPASGSLHATVTD